MNYQTVYTHALLAKIALRHMHIDLASSNYLSNLIGKTGMLGSIGLLKANEVVSDVIDATFGSLRKLFKFNIKDLIE